MFVTSSLCGERGVSVVWCSDWTWRLTDRSAATHSYRLTTPQIIIIHSYIQRTETVQVLFLFNLLSVNRLSDRTIRQSDFSSTDRRSVLSHATLLTWFPPVSLSLVFYYFLHNLLIHISPIHPGAHSKWILTSNTHTHADCCIVSLFYLFPWKARIGKMKRRKVEEEQVQTPHLSHQDVLNK